MIFGPLVPGSAVSLFSTFGVVNGKAATNVNRKGQPAIPDVWIDPDTGLIKSWKAPDDNDTNILKQAVESGMLNGYNVNQVKEEYPRYRRFHNKCLGDKISGLKKSHRQALERVADSKLLLTNGIMILLTINVKH